MKGWECPKCGRVYAPHIPECGSCNPVATAPAVPNAWPLWAQPGIATPIPLNPPYKVGDAWPFDRWTTCGPGAAAGANGIDRNVHAWN